MSGRLTVDGAGLDDGLVDLHQVVGVGPRRILGAELDLGVAPELLPAVADPADRLGERLLAGHPELVLEVDVARRDEHVEVRSLGDPDGLDRPLRVAVAAAGERRDGDVLRVSLAIRWTASKSPGEAAGKPASMTSTLSRTSWRATSSFSAVVSAGAGRLLAVAQGRVEDADAALGAGGPRLRRAPYAAGAHRAAPGVVAEACAWPATDLDRVEERHLAAQVARRPARSGDRDPAERRRSNSGRPDSFSAIQRPANVPSWMSAQDLLHASRGRARR